MQRVVTKRGIILILIVTIFLFLMVKPNSTQKENAGPLFLLGFIWFVAALWVRETYKKIDDLIFKIEKIPILDVREATPGVPFSGYGTIDAPEVYISPFSGEECVYCHYKVDMVPSILIFAQGQPYYVPLPAGIHNENKTIWLPFYLRDKNGDIIRVYLTGIDRDLSEFPFARAEQDAGILDEQKNSEVEGIYTAKRKLSSGILTGLVGGYQYSEYILRNGEEVYVVGMVKEDENGKYIEEDKDVPLIISLKKKEEYLKEFKAKEKYFYLSHLILSFSFTWWLIYLYHLNIFSILTISLTGWLLLLGNILILGWVPIMIYNRIITAEERCKNALSSIDVELKRRADLISRLSEVIKRYMRHERALQIMTAERRAAIMMTKDLIKPRYLQKVSSLIANLESYPELNASQLSWI
ncbi:MAG: GIDE domain-containing protein [Candidatus Methanomethylicaceae archaeon]